MSGAKPGYLNLGSLCYDTDHGELVNGFKADYRDCVSTRRKNLMLSRLATGQLANRLGIADLLQAFFLTKQSLFAEGGEQALQEALVRYLASELGLAREPETTAAVVPAPAPVAQPAPVPKPEPVVAPASVVAATEVPPSRAERPPSAPSPAESATATSARQPPPLTMGISRPKRPQKQ